MGCTDRKNIEVANAGMHRQNDIEEENEGTHRQKGHRGRECIEGCTDRKEIEEENALWDAQTERT